MFVGVAHFMQFDILILTHFVQFDKAKIPYFMQFSKKKCIFAVKTNEDGFAANTYRPKRRVENDGHFFALFAQGGGGG